MALAQENDEVGIWSELGIEKAITKNWDVGLDLEYRAQNRSRLSTGISTGYKLNKYLKFGIGYNYLHTFRPDKYKEKSEYKDKSEGDSDNYTIGYNQTTGYNRTFAYSYPRHRFSVDAIGSIKFWGWLKVSLRERYQLTFCRARTATTYKYREKYRYRENYEKKVDFDDDWNEITWYDMNKTETTEITETMETEVKPSSTDQVLRSRLKLEFDKKRNPFSPFISAELHNSVKPGDKMLLQKIRTAAGLSYKFRKHHEVTFAYLLTFDIHDIEEDVVVSVHNRMHAINFGYNYSF